jgi:hypothetical protein
MDPINVARHLLVMNAVKCEATEEPQGTEMWMTKAS